MPGAAQFLATARTDERDWLVEADEPLAGLQLRCGGELPGIVAPPALLELVQTARRQGVRLAREIEARDALETVTAWVEVEPDGTGGGCTISVAEWRAARLADEDHQAIAARRAAVERHLAELTARLGPGQEVVAVDCESPELSEIAERLRTGRGKRWTELVEVAADTHRHSGNWRLLDGVRVVVPGSARSWKAALLPLGRSQTAPTGFELLLVAVEAPGEAGEQPARESLFGATIGREIAPVLFQPMSRIIANADTIRTQLAGPLSEEYSKYAADIATAGEHLMALVDDLVDLEAVEADDFDTAIERIDLADAVRRAAGVLSARAHEREIVVDVPADHEQVLAIGESRRVLQILLNVLGNALRYCPAGSQVSLRAEQAGDRARITVADQGEGLTREQQARVFDKFERLGRGEDGGSGLGLYISRRLARAMGGDLSVESAPGQGARFILELPAFEVET